MHACIPLHKYNLLVCSKTLDICTIMASKRAAVTTDTLDATTHKAVKREYRIYYEKVHSPCGCPEVTRGQIGESYTTAAEANAAAQEHAAAMLEHGYHEVTPTFRMGLYTANVDDGGDEQVDICVTEGKKVTWATDEMIEQLKEVAEEEDYEAQEVPLVEEDIDALVRGGGGDGTAFTSWEAQLESLDWGSAPGLVNPFSR